MRTLSHRAATGLALVCLLFTLAVAAVGLTAVLGVRADGRVANSVATDELTTSNATAHVGRLLDRAYSDAGQILLAGFDPTGAAQAADALANHVIPVLETGVADLVALHAADAPDEHADVTRFAAGWGTLRGVLNQVRPGLAPGLAQGLALSLKQAYAPLSAAIDRLLDREVADAAAGRAQTDAATASTTRTLLIAMLLVALGAAAVTWWGRRALRRALEPTQEQVEFGDTLQLAKDEDETRRLLQRYLERSLPDSSAVVLNRNNSADRLEAMTPLDADSPLVPALRSAEPDSCLAIRSGRTHRVVEGSEPLLACAVCSGCGGNRICSPLTVGGEVIGAVLTGRAARYDLHDAQRIRESVSQAAPVLANLRNLALAEFRAATDSLTGLPNKRAVTDTTKRMFAQASRSHSALSLLMLDLDHFKHINDNFGHAVGDLALANVGAAIRAALRGSDFAGRNGGEEFSVLLPETPVDAAHEVAEKIRNAIAEIHLPGVELRITASVGVATFPTHAGSVERLERLADSALYLAKRSGRNRTELARVDDGETEPANPEKPETSRRHSGPHLGPHRAADPAAQRHP